jgi:hypothetical protein
MPVVVDVLLVECAMCLHAYFDAISLAIEVVRYDVWIVVAECSAF